MTVKTDYSRNFSYARMQNGMPAVRSVLIRNTEKETLTDVRMSIRFDPPFSSGYDSVLSAVPKGKFLTASEFFLPPPFWRISPNGSKDP